MKMITAQNPHRAVSEFRKLIACVGLVAFNFADKAAAQSGPWTADQGFSSIQGANEWYYQQRPQGGGAVTNLTWNPGPGYSDPVHGATGFWETADATGWLYWSSTHPGQTCDTIRKWVAPLTTTVAITGRVYKLDTSGGAGVIATVEKNGTSIWSKTVAYNDATGYATDSDLGSIAVNSGDSIAFIVDDNGTYGADATTWDPTITVNTSNSGPWDAIAQLTSTQGSNGWYYQQRPQGATSPVTNMSYSSGAWRTTDFPGGNYGWLGFTLGTDGHPGGSLDVIRNWVAPSGGTVSITGRVYKVDTSGGAGIIATVEKNGTSIWSKTVAYNDATGYAMDSSLGAVSVNSGDSIAFIVDDNGTYGSDGYAWDPVITKYYDAIAQLTSTQGSNGWYYQQRPQGATSPVANMSYSSGAWRTTDFPGGDWGWLGFTVGEDGHPGGSLDVIRNWVAPSGGTVSVTGRVYKVDTSGGAGIIATVEHNGTSVWSKTVAYNDATGYAMDSSLSSITINSGDSIAFIVDDNGTYGADGYAWDPIITFGGGGGSGSYYAKGQFSSVQGQNQWYYQQRPIGTSTYTNMATYSSGAWRGGNGNFITDHSFISDNVNDAVRTWVAPITGTVNISGRAYLINLAGNGIGISVVQNTTTLWSNILNANSWFGYVTDDDPILGAVHVNAGDSLRFVVTNNGNPNAETGWNPDITYVATPVPSNTSYYVSASGSDSNSGTDSSHPWLTVAPLNAIHYFGAGVQILFHGGDTFAGGLNISMTGTSVSRDTIGSYGTGNATLTDLASSGDTTTDIIQLANPSYVTVNDLNLTGTAGTNYGTTSFVPGNHSFGVFMYSRTTTGNKHESVYINDIVCENSFGGVIADTEGPTADGFDDFQITSSIFNANWEIGAILLGYDPYNGGPVNQESNVYIGSNQFFDIKGYVNFTGDAGGVGISNATGITIEKNLCGDIAGIGPDSGGGSTAIVVSNSRNFIIQRNEVYGTSSSTPYDGSAIDADQDSSNGEIAYNLTYNNGGPGIETGSFGGKTNSNIVIHHNMSYNDVRGNASTSNYGAITVWGSTDQYQIFNNTVYVDESGIVSGSTPSAIDFQGSNTNTKIWNNILKTTQGMPMIRANSGSHLDSSTQCIANLYDSSGGSLLISNDDTHGNYTNITSLSSWQTDGQEKISSTLYGVVASAGLTSLTAPSGYLPSQQVSAFTNFDLTAGSAARGQANSPWSIVTLTSPLTVQTFDFHGNTATITDIGADTY